MARAGSLQPLPAMTQGKPVAAAAARREGPGPGIKFKMTPGDPYRLKFISGYDPITSRGTVRMAGVMPGGAKRKAAPKVQGGARQEEKDAEDGKEGGEEGVKEEEEGAEKGEGGGEEEEEEGEAGALDYTQEFEQEEGGDDGRREGRGEE
eukprot:1424622-Rhodomonas_salina.3